MKAIVEAVTEIFHNCETEKHPKGNLPSTWNFSEHYNFLQISEGLKLSLHPNWADP